MIAPACSMNFGQSKPNSNDRTVPDTAPIAKKIATPRDHAFARSRYTCFPVFIHLNSATNISQGIVIPIQAKTMWKTNETVICSLAARKSSINYIFLKTFTFIFLLNRKFFWDQNYRVSDLNNRDLKK